MTVGRIGRTVGDSTPSWPVTASTAPDEAPNVVTILFDDVGFAHFGCFGSSVSTPNIDRLAAEGLRYTNFHTTAVCSPTRASLLTGRNCHSVGFGHVTERLAGYPGYSMRLPDTAATIAQMLADNGYSTRAVGKWHLTPSYETGPQGPFERWPLGRGFQRFYGFLGGSTDQFNPELYRDNSPVEPPTDRRDYHLSADLVDEGIRQIRDLRAIAPNRPFFLYLATGACHAPHQAPREYIDRYRGAFDHGWDVERERILARQIESGVMPAGTELGTSNPGVVEWESLSDDERRLAARMMEVYAAFLTYTDEQIGRLLDALDELGIADDTVVMLCSDNGASGEGGPAGSVDEGLYLNDQPQRAADGLEHLDRLGGPELYNHYPWGWAQAGNTPFRWYKQFTHAGGITNGLVLRWPGGRLPAGEIRTQYHHVIDIAPTILDIAGIEPPATVRGVTQQPLHGVSMAYSFHASDEPGLRTAQHYEMWGNRGYYDDGWMAICRLQQDAPGAVPPAAVPPFDELTWELYDHRHDPAENHDLAAEHPARLAAMVDSWWAAAGRYDVLPVDNRQRAQRWPVDPPTAVGAIPDYAEFSGPGGPYERGVAPKIAGRSFRLIADVVVDESTDRSGVLFSAGGHHGGYCWYLADDELRLEIARSSIDTETVAAPLRLDAGAHRLMVSVTAADDLSGEVELTADADVLVRRSVDRLLKRMPIGNGRTYVGYTAQPTVSGDVTAPARLTVDLRRLVATAGERATVDEGAELNAELREQ